MNKYIAMVCFHKLIKTQLILWITFSIIIYMNNKILSGNIITDFPDHYMQFVSVVREKIDYEPINIFKRDYSKFLKVASGMMFQYKTLIIILKM